MARKIQLKPLFWKIILLLAILILGLAVVFCYIKIAHSRTDKFFSQNLAKIESDYAQRISSETDAYTLVKTGQRQMKINLPDLAKISLKRATEISPDYRDAWVLLSSAQLLDNDAQAALASLQTAQKIDPICAKTYELLKIVYENLGNSADAQKMQEKYEYLSKK